MPDTPRIVRLCAVLLQAALVALTSAQYLGKVMPMGDSITAGLGSANGYRKVLQDSLAARGITLTYCGQLSDFSEGMVVPWHEGHLGWSIEDLTAGRDGFGNAPAWLTRDHPTTVLLMAGTNNGLLPIPQMRAAYASLLDACLAQEPSVRIYWASIPRSFDLVTGRADWEGQVNLLTRDMAAEYRQLGFDIRYVDVTDALDFTTDLADNYHPNAEGYAKIARAFQQAMTRRIPSGISTSWATPSVGQ